MVHKWCIIAISRACFVTLSSMSWFGFGFVEGESSVLLKKSVTPEMVGFGWV
jgi:hypothetical protein